MPERLADYQFGVRREVPFHRDRPVRYTVVGALEYINVPLDSTENSTGSPTKG